MPTNVSIHFQKAEAEYLKAKTIEEKIRCLKKMISLAPTHKSAENLRAQLKARLKKLKDEHEKKIKTKKSRKKSIKKAEQQAVLVGLTNSGKSSILANITNARPKISEVEFTTLSPIIGTLDYQGIQVQILDMPSINHENFDQSLANTTDLLLIVITQINEIKQIEPFLQNATKNRLIILNKSDLLSEQEKRKVAAYLSTKKYNFILYSALSRENETLLKEKIINSFKICRIYTKSPNEKFPDEKPVIMPKNSTIKQLAKKIGIPPESIKKAKITGPSSKFPNQVVGLSHVLKDKDVVELQTK